MKTLAIFFMILSGSALFAQSSDYHWFLEELYFGRQPSPKSASMGGGFSAYTENEFGSYYNPALTSLDKGLTINTSFSQGYPGYKGTSYNFLNASYNFKKVGTFSVSSYNVNYKIVERSWIPEDQNEYLYKNNHTIYTFNYSRDISKDFIAGININSVQPHYFNPYNSKQYLESLNKSLYSLDAGILIKIPVSKINADVFQGVQIGGAFYNITNSKAYTPAESYYEPAYYFPLPQIFRLGFSYNINIRKNKLISNLSLMNLLVHLENESVVNSNRNNEQKIGIEGTLIDLISVRAGYSSMDKDNINYGIGLNLPISLLLEKKSPVDISINYASLKPVPTDNYIEYPEDVTKYQMLSFKLNWTPGF
ncbi:MAG: hypothetical protein JST55_03360 [Bacteroidetes bacterium]|nr:hypothetical protein [Bacteroidota bacterium]